MGQHIYFDLDVDSIGQNVIRFFFAKSTSENFRRGWIWQVKSHSTAQRMGKLKELYNMQSNNKSEDIKYQLKEFAISFDSNTS